MAPPSKLTKKVCRAIEREIEDGAGFQDACRLAGIHPKTGQRWRRVGLQDREAGNNTTLRARLSIAADRAEAQRKTAARKAVAERIADGDERPDLQLKASTWYLEKTEPAEFGQRIEVKVTEGLKERILFARDHMSRAAYLEMITAFALYDDVDLAATLGDVDAVLSDGGGVGEAGEPSDDPSRLH